MLLRMDETMNMFGLPADELDRAGAHWTAREILQQPQLWQEIGRQAAAALPEIRALLDGQLAGNPARRDARVILTGAGTSAYIGECLAPTLRQVLRCRVDAVATTDLVADPAANISSDPPALLVSFGRSGNSPESIAALEIVEAATPACAHLVFTCNAAGALSEHARRASRSCVLVLPERSNDRSFAMTSSFTGMLWAAAGTLGAISQIAPRSLVLGGLAQEMLSRCTPLLQRLVADRFERVVYLGAKELKGLAREAALKMLELTDGAVLALGETPLGFRHGPKTIVNDRTLVVAMLSNDPYTRRYDLDLLSELRQDGVARAVIALGANNGTADAGAGSSASADNVEVATPRGTAPCSDLELCLPYAVFAQSLALLRSLSLRVTPDNPNPAGTVHRVVRGVTIHPWPGSA
jgi:D-galactosamine 6-phosphate deaminase/isomerase